LVSVLEKNACVFPPQCNTIQRLEKGSQWTGSNQLLNKVSETKKKLKWAQKPVIGAMLKHSTFVISQGGNGQKDEVGRPVATLNLGVPGKS